MTANTVRPASGWMTMYLLRPVLTGLKHTALILFFAGKLVFEFFWWLATEMKNWPVVKPVVKGIDWMVERLPLWSLVGFYLFEIVSTPFFATYDTYLVFQVCEHTWEKEGVTSLLILLAIKLFKIIYYVVLTRIFALRCKEVMAHPAVSWIPAVKDKLMGFIRETAWWQFLCRQSDYVKRRAKVWFRYFTRRKPFCRAAAA